MAVGSKPRIRFGFGCLSDLPPLARGVFDEDDVAVLGEYAQSAVFIRVGEKRRSKPRLVIGELAEIASVTVNDIRVEGRVLAIGRLFPLEINLRAVTGPANLRGLSADQIRAAHEALDGEVEFWFRIRFRRAYQRGKRGCIRDYDAEGRSKHVI